MWLAGLMTNVLLLPGMCVNATDGDESLRSVHRCESQCKMERRSKVSETEPESV